MLLNVILLMNRLITFASLMVYDMLVLWVHCSLNHIIKNNLFSLINVYIIRQTVAHI